MKQKEKFIHTVEGTRRCTNATVVTTETEISPIAWRKQKQLLSCKCLLVVNTEAKDNRTCVQNVTGITDLKTKQQQQIDTE